MSLAVEPAAGRHEQLISAQRARAAVELDHHVAVLDAHRGRQHAEVHLHALLLQRLADVLARERLLTPDQPVAALDEAHVAAEARVRLRHLDADHAATEDHEPLGHLLGGRGLAVGPWLHVIEARDRRDQRRRAGRDDHGAPRHQRFVADLDPALAVEAAGAADDRDAAVLEPGLHVRVVEAVDDLVAAVEHRADVEVAGHRLAHARDPARLGEQLAGAQQRLRGHAGVERALAADQVRLDDRDVEARLPQPARGDLAGRPGAEDDHVEFALAHGGTVSPGRDPLRAPVPRGK